MGRIVEGLKAAIKNLTGVRVDGRTKGEVLENYNAKTAVIPLTINVIDTNGAVEGATVALKEGSVVGSGTAVNVGSNGKYSVKLGEYNYSVTKVGYTTATGTISITASDATIGSRTVTVTLVANV